MAITFKLAITPDAPYFTILLFLKPDDFTYDKFLVPSFQLRFWSSEKNYQTFIIFHFVIREGHVGIVQYFLDTFPDIWDTVSNNGRTPLHTAGIKIFN